MRRLILLSLLAVVFLSCTQLTQIPEETEMIAFDFSEFSAKGFMFTPNIYAGDYESVGLLEIKYFPEANLKPFETKTTNRVLRWVHEPISPQVLLKVAYDKASKMGADALTQFYVSREIRENKKAKINRDGYKITGFAIKRKK
ncbi:MAG: hypothetical protein DWQ06_02555 [Calditrichaeota bacterium]|nr:MAG: hypothetical protein DWQ06_02555 [Calditrichota bacterium]